MNVLNSDVIIGSGPTGYATAIGLIQLGRKPIVVDFGQAYLPQRSRIVRAPSIAMKGEEDRSNVFYYPHSMITSEDDGHLPISSARGGLSNLWGAGLLMRSRQDMPELDEIYEGIELGYFALLKRIAKTGTTDQTSQRFPWVKETSPGPQSRRYSILINQLQKTEGGPLFGFPRVALNSSGCIRCGKCLQGCPENLFFSSKLELEILSDQGLITFVDGPVLGLDPQKGRVHLRLPNQTLISERVFLAAGPVATPALLQHSGLAPERIVVQDSAVFYTGFINTLEVSGDESTFTHSQGVAYSRNNGAGDFQLAFYDSNPEYAERLSKLSPIIGRILKSSKMLNSKLNAAIGFLDSSVSGHLVLRYSGGRTWVSRQYPKNARRNALSIIRSVNSYTAALGLHSIPGAVIVPPPGSGYHSGSGMPMGGEFVDYSGRLKNAKNIFVVDATSLPRIHAGAHTLTAMANAYRIAQSAL